jgi:adenine deaminase
VIGVVENQAPTEALTADLPVVDGWSKARATCARSPSSNGIAARGGGERLRLGLRLQGRMAMASTVAHDSHHMIVVGTDREMMARAAMRLGEVGGGVTVWKDGEERRWWNCPSRA